MNSTPKPPPNNTEDGKTPAPDWQENIRRQMGGTDPDGYLKREAPPTEKQQRTRNAEVLEVRMHREGSLN